MLTPRQIPRPSADAHNARYPKPTPGVTALDFGPPWGGQGKHQPPRAAGNARPTFYSTAVLLALMLLMVPMAQSAQAEVVWWDQPPLPYVLPLTFIDTVAVTVRAEHLSTWRAVRDRALEAWGIPHAVGEEWSGALLPFDGTHGEQVAVPGVIRIGRDTSGACQDYGGFMGTVGGGVAVVYLYPLWWKDNNVRSVSGDLGHEIGHAFGLGHTSTGIMGGARLPNAEELAAVQEYYA